MILMKRSTIFANEMRKGKPGRPRIGGDVATAVAVRLPAEILAQVDEWAASNDLKRSDAIRDLIERALTATPRRPAKRKAGRNDPPGPSSRIKLPPLHWK